MTSTTFPWPDGRDHEIRGQAGAAGEAWLLILFFFAVYQLARQADPGTPLRWGVYAIPALSLLLALAPPKKQFDVDRRFLLASVGYVLVAAASIAFNPGTRALATRDVLIVLGYLITFVPGFRVEGVHLRVLTVCFGVALVPTVLASGFGGEQRLNLIDSEGLFESVVAFPLAALALFHMHRRNWLWFAVTVALGLMAFKRIAVGGLGIAISFYLAAEVAQRWLPRRPAILGARLAALTIVVMLAIVGLSFDAATEAIVDRFRLSRGPNAATLGRYETSRRIQAITAGQALPQHLVGNGPGSSKVLPNPYGENVNPHNDFLKLYFEYGVVGLAGFLAILFVIYGASTATISLLVLNACLMVTDNTLIYFFHQFVCLAIVRCLTCNGEASP